jgi:hypothetical protein
MLPALKFLGQLCLVAMGLGFCAGVGHAVTAYGHFQGWW